MALPQIRTLRSLPALCCLASALGAISCSGARTVASDVPPGAVAGGEAPAAALAGFSRGPFERELLLTGEMEAVRSIAIKAPQTSIFQMRIQFMAEEGSVVNAGDPLLSFESSTLGSRVLELETSILDAETQIVSKRNELASALKDLEIELAEREYEDDRSRLDAGVDPEVLSRKLYGERQLAHTTAQRNLTETRERIRLTKERGQAELDVLLINRDKLRKDLISTQRDLDLLTIKAPAEGLVVYETRENSTLRYQEGDSCWPGQGVMRLPDLTEMQVLFTVNEVDAPRLTVGEEVRVRLDAFPDRELAATISHVPSMAVKRADESKIAVFKVRASLSETWKGEMKPGMSVRGRIVLERLNGAPLIGRGDVETDGEAYWLRDGVAAGGRKAGEGRTEIHPLGRNATHYLLTEEEFVALSGNAEAGPKRAALGGERP